MNTKKKVIILSVSIIILVVMVIGLSYAWYSLTLSGTKSLTISTSGSLSLVLDDSMDGEITLTEAEPVSDETGKAQKGYTFTLKNNGTIASDYTIYLDDMPLTEESNRIPDNKIKYYLEKDTTEVATKLLSETGVNPNRILDTGNIAKGKTITYKLKLWIDSAAGNEVMGKELKTKVRVVANQATSTLAESEKTLAALNLSAAVIKTPATLTQTAQGSNEVGLYKSTDTNDGIPTYYFRGAVTNNYVSFAGETWRIIRINEDGTIRIMLEDKMNNTEYKFNSDPTTYDKMYYTNSELKGVVDNWYTTNIGNNQAHDSKVASGDYFCEQAKVKGDTPWTSGNATMTVYTSYTPNFKCATDGNNKGVVNGKIGLMTVDEAWHAGSHPEAKDTTFYMYKGDGFYEWTMSPAGFISTHANSWTLFSGAVNYRNFSNLSYGVRPVLNLNSGTLVSGNGTQSSSYVIQ